MANRYIKMVYTRLMIGEMYFKVTLKYCSTLEIVMSKETRIENASKNVDKGKRMYTVAGL